MNQLTNRTIKQAINTHTRINHAVNPTSGNLTAKSLDTKSLEDSVGSFAAQAKYTVQNAIGVFNHHVTQYWHFLDGQDELTRSFELIKVLRQHQTNRRWTLLIAPTHIPDKTLLDCCSVDMSHVLLVREKQITSMPNAIEKALNANTCCAIVAWCNRWHEQLSQSQLQHLSQLADTKNCHVYAFNKQAHQSTLVSTYN